MTGVLEQIDREIVALERATDHLSNTLEDLYARYLEALGQSVQQQQMMATYHLCTQTYPDRFLALSFSQRQTLQEALRKLGRQAQAELQQQLSCLRERPPALDAQEKLLAAGGFPPGLVAEIAAAVKARIAEQEADASESGDSLAADNDDEQDLDGDGLPSIGDRSADSSPDMDMTAENDLEGQAQDLGLFDLFSRATEDPKLPLIAVDRSTPMDADKAIDSEDGESQLEIDQAETDQAKTDQAEIDQDSDWESDRDRDAAALGEADEPLNASNDPDQVKLMADLMQQIIPEDSGEPLPEQTGPRSPMDLARQQMRLEHHLRRCLRGLSRDTNRLLQKAEIVANLPEPVIAAASEADAASDQPSRTPNLLDVLVEIPGEDENESDDNAPRDRPRVDRARVNRRLKRDRDGDEKRELELELPDPESMTHLVALNLRLSEIEFADTKVSLWRTKIREQLARLKKLGRQYQKLQRQRAIAEAEAAWRASWFDDSLPP